MYVAVKNKPWMKGHRSARPLILTEIMVSIGKTSLASKRKYTFQDFPHMNALGIKFDLATN